MCIPPATRFASRQPRRGSSTQALLTAAVAVALATAAPAQLQFDELQALPVVSGVPAFGR